jgi:hypothetical protein
MRVSSSKDRSLAQTTRLLKAGLPRRKDPKYGKLLCAVKTAAIIKAETGGGKKQVDEPAGDPSYAELLQVPKGRNKYKMRSTSPHRVE